MTPDAIPRIRRFTRAVAAARDALDTAFLTRGRPLGAARVLTAIGQGRTDVAAIRAEFDLDSGLMSRLLRSLEAEGLIETRRDRYDARRRIARLTPAGQAECAAYEDLAHAQARAMIAGHADPDSLLAAMDLIAAALARHPGPV
jgi:DNA-binding MarR family transcriptional regulator